MSNQRGVGIFLTKNTKTAHIRIYLDSISFSDVKNNVLRVSRNKVPMMTIDNHGCNDNYDDANGNDEKITKNLTNNMSLE